MKAILPQADRTDFSECALVKINRLRSESFDLVDDFVDAIRSIQPADGDRTPIIGVERRELRLKCNPL